MVFTKCITKVTQLEHLTKFTMFLKILPACNFYVLYGAREI